MLLTKVRRTHMKDGLRLQLKVQLTAARSAAHRQRVIQSTLIIHPTLREVFPFEVKTLSLGNPCCAEVSAKQAALQYSLKHYT